MTRLHPDLADLAMLIGTWRGSGRGIYPTIDDFSYSEEITISPVPDKPFLHYGQRTRRTGEHPDSGRPLHTETGYWRSGGPGRAELLLAQPTGIVEVYEGPIAGNRIELRATTVGRSKTAKEVTSVERIFTLTGDVLEYRMLMGAVGMPHQLHLEAELRRV